MTENPEANNKQGYSDTKPDKSSSLTEIVESNAPTETPSNGSSEKADPKIERSWNRLPEWIIIFLTCALCVIAFFQWRVLCQTDETSRLRDRAYVYFFTPSFTPYPSEDSPTEWIFKIVIHNSGNMPAQSLNIRYAVIVSPILTDIAPIMQAKWTQANTPKTFGPKQDFIFQLFDAKTITMDEFRKMKKSGSIGKFILAEATYFDGFSLEHRVTKMGVRLNVDTTGAYSFSFTRNHNCTDDACD